MLLWRGVDAWRVEAASVELTDDGVVATGTQIAADPTGYRLAYHLDASHRFVTRSLAVEVHGDAWWRRLELRHDGRGTWVCESESDGTPGLPQPGGDMAKLDGALDCDLGLSPLTNLMPIRRSGLDRRDGGEDFLMAWVSVPDLGVDASGQRYEHVRRTDDGSVVRYISRGLSVGFEAELELDADGFVITYPGLGERVGDTPVEP